ncbi:MAG: outer membrane beta-barrel protein [Pseudomonadales bacterium]|nr:outer membrane beta-barrel protein [Pseudomonadales bacterium]
MTNRLFTTLLLSVLLSANISHASGFFGGLGFSTSTSKISTQNETNFESSGRLFSGYAFDENWSLEVGYLGFSEFKFDTEKDAVSEYTVSIDRWDIYLAPAYEFNPRGFLPLRFMAGLTYSDVTLSVEENFYNQAPGGTNNVDDHVLGVLISAGFRPFNFKHIASLLSIDYIRRPNLFSGSNRSFDSSERSVSFTVFFR